MPDNDGDSRLISQDSTDVLKILIVTGELLASLYATYKIVDRALMEGVLNYKNSLVPFSFLLTLASSFLFILNV